MCRVLVCSFLLLFGAAGATAQEVSVPLDSTGKIFVITSELENKLGLFLEYPGFVEARLYQANDSAYFLEILEQRDSSIVRLRVPQTLEQVAELRRQVSSAIAQRSPQSMYDQDGRGGLIINSAILSAGFYGWAIPVASKADGSGAVALYFFITAAGVLGPYFATENADISRATAMMDFYGGSRGIAHGVALYYAFDPEEDSERAPYGWATIVSLGERIALNQWAAKSGMSVGKAAVIGVGGDFGLGMSAILVSGHELWNREHQGEAGISILGGSLLGMIAGTQMADHGSYTRGDAYVLRGIGILGAAVPAALADVGEQSGKTAANLATLGTVMGLGLGHGLLRNKDFSSSQGLTILLAEFGGAALGTAVVIAARTDDSGPYSMAAAVGGSLGFMLGYANASRSGRTIRRTSDLEFHFNPLPLMTELPRGANAEADHRAGQALSLTYKF